MRPAFWIAIVLVACGTDPSIPGGDDTPPLCELGERAACDCAPGSVGTMICDDGGAFGTCGSCSVPDPDPMRVNFQAQIVPILNRSCGTDGMGCHARDAYGASMNQECRGWLTLENEALGAKFYSGPRNGQTTGCPDMSLHRRLTQIDVWQCLSTSASYVSSGDPAKSYILNKLDGVNMCKESADADSEQMPPADSMFTISATDKALIRQWIIEGALDN